MIRKRFKKPLAILLAMIMMFSAVPMTAYAAALNINDVIKDTANYIQKTVKNPQVGSVGGEWAVIGLARSEFDIPDSYYDNYYKNVEAYVKAADGILHDKKYTEYSRVILGLTAAGYDPTDVAGYDLTTALGDFEKTIWQGINGPVFALIALDSDNYSMPENPKAKVQATRDMYINEILKRQLPDGGFSLYGGTEEADDDYQSDPDITAMALQALAKYQDREDVKKVTEEALDCLSKLQNNKGGYASWNEENSESVAQVIAALGELGISLDDPRFVKNGNTLLNNLMTFYIKNQGFSHTIDGGSNLMATEQAFYALVAANRSKTGKNSLYRMGDTDTAQIVNPPAEDTEIGLPGKHTDVKLMLIITPGKTFDDIGNHIAKSSIEALAERGIINGKTEKIFDADSTMTRAEFASIIVKGLGLPRKNDSIFTDVSENSWYADVVGTAYSYGIVKGTTPTTFNPLGTISREEAAAMVARAAKLTGMETAVTDGEVRDILAQFTDYITSSNWARPSLAFCYQKNILSQDDIDIRPKDAIKRYEVAKMLYSMLEAANLL
ncbi:S-layer homology domain-containing protein [Paratissierella segnis]|jgi:hypothetical protein|uniref:S-layer homology domain-containing protein n=1 Tax=Paratissierella segnis TaxID=2763679 RepID=A0A926F018_9FIRM|nr:S-layer homology domain-containing protein [Paratissierella segnis]MBC8589504.1 S-layer homology domain-containing protein [Paratissierella segnis]